MLATLSSAQSFIMDVMTLFFHTGPPAMQFVKDAEIFFSMDRDKLIRDIRPAFESELNFDRHVIRVSSANPGQMLDEFLAVLDAWIDGERQAGDLLGNVLQAAVQLQAWIDAERKGSPLQGEVESLPDDLAVAYQTWHNKLEGWSRALETCRAILSHDVSIGDRQWYAVYGATEHMRFSRDLSPLLGKEGRERIPAPLYAHLRKRDELHDTLSGALRALFRHLEDVQKPLHEKMVESSYDIYHFLHHRQERILEMIRDHPEDMEDQELRWMLAVFCLVPFLLGLLTTAALCNPVAAPASRACRIPVPSPGAPSIRRHSPPSTGFAPHERGRIDERLALIEYRLAQLEARREEKGA